MSASDVIPGDVAWRNGTFVPRADLALSVGDSGFVLGATVTEQLRTFHGRLFLPAAHAERLQASLTAIGIRPSATVDDLLAAADKVAAHNHRLALAAAHGNALAPDLAVVIFVTPGDHPAQHGGRPGAPVAVVHSFPLAFRAWAAAYEEGIALRSVSITQVPTTCWPLHAKVRSRLHYFLADREASSAEPGARALLAHADGRISETTTANVAIVRRGMIVAPPDADALPGISLAHVERLAAREGIACRRESLRAADVCAADEMLLTSTPSCLLPATRFDGHPIGTGRAGPVYRRLLAAWSHDVGLDIEAQARRHAGGGG
jgi:branched-subunit amino acid aminotransferase/4-amino-4-deoxychorismate lyase